MARIEVRGAEQLTRLSAVLTGHAEGKSIRRRLSKTIKGQSDHITREQREALATDLPHHGGLAGTVSSEAKLSVRTTLAGNSAGVTIVDSWRGHDMKSIDDGLIRHPIWGRWVKGKGLQRVRPGSLSRPVKKNQTRLRFAIVRSLDELAAEIAKEI